MNKLRKLTIVEQLSIVGAVVRMAIERLFEAAKSNDLFRHFIMHHELSLLTFMTGFITIKPFPKRMMEKRENVYYWPKDENSAKGFFLITINGNRYIAIKPYISYTFTGHIMFFVSNGNSIENHDMSEKEAVRVILDEIVKSLASYTSVEMSRRLYELEGKRS